jgi:SlyX protein
LPDAALEQRLVELETRLAFQEHALVELGDALAATRLENVRQADLLRRALEELRSNRGSLYADPATEPPPPHY